MSPITTHVLDTSLGCPAEGVPVVLYQVRENGESVELARGTTNSDGRIADLLPAGDAQPGTYRIEFDVADYFLRSVRDAFYPKVEVLFHVAAAGGHYHVPLLLSPFGYSTYRGS